MMMIVDFQDCGPTDLIIGPDPHGPPPSRGILTQRLLFSEPFFFIFRFFSLSLSFPLFFFSL